MGARATRISDVPVVGRSPPAGRHSVSGSGVEEGGRELKNLNAVLLGEVFSYPPQHDRLEAMLVSKYWEKVQIEGLVPWRKVCVGQLWDLRGKGTKNGKNASMFRVLKSAQELKFFSHFENDSKYIMSLGSVLGANLRSIELPRMSISTPVFHSFLAACPQLRSLVFKREPKGYHPIHIAHPRLERLLLRTPTVGRSLTVNCPSLTHLATLSSKDDESYPVIGDTEPPSLHCPQLKVLHLCAHHCASGVLNSIADQAPDLEVLEASRTANCPMVTLLRFRSLQVLTFKRIFLETTPWAEQERVGLLVHREGSGAELAAAYQELRELNVYAAHGFFAPTVTCPKLESLTLSLDRFRITEAGKRCLRSLNSVCPRLKRLLVEVSGDKGEADPLEVFHEAVEEVEVVTYYSLPTRITCQNVGKLRIKCSYPMERELSLELECAKLTDLKMGGYPNLACLPSILSVLPCLKNLRVSNVRSKSEMVLDHAHIKEVVLESCSLGKFVLAMRSLERVRLDYGTVQWIQVECFQRVALELDSHPKKKARRKMFEVGEMIDVDLSRWLYRDTKSSPFYRQPMGKGRALELYPELREEL